MRAGYAAAVLTALTLVVGVPSASTAESMVYEYEESPLFSIDIPTDWTTDLNFEQEAREAGVPEGEEPLFRVVEVSPADGGHVWLGFWAVPMASSIDEGVAYFESLGGDLFADKKVGDPQDSSHNDMAVRTWKGTGTHQGEEVEFVMAIFEPRTGTVAAALYVGAKDAWQTYRAELEAMVASIRPAGD